MRYFTVNIDDAQRLGLTGSDLLVWGALQYLAKHQAWKGSYRQLAEYSGCGSDETASRCVRKLLQKQLILSTENGLSLPQNVAVAPQNVATIPQNVAKLKESTKENINNIKKTTRPSYTRTREDVGQGGQTDGLFSKDFILWWNKYNPSLEYDNRKGICYEQWQKIPSDWKKLAIEKAMEHLPETNPYFWLKEEAFLRVGLSTVVVPVGKAPAPASPHWLTGEEQEESLRMGVTLVVCQNPETGKFGAVTKEEAERFGLTIKRVM